MRRVAAEGWEDAVARFEERTWDDRALHILNLPVEGMTAQEFRKSMERWDAPVTARSLGRRSDQRDEVALLQRVALGVGALGFTFDQGDLQRFFDFVGQLQLGPLPSRRDGGQEVLFEPTPSNLTFGRRAWPSVASAALLLYLVMGGFVGPRLRVCQLPDCGRFFLSGKQWARWCSVAHRVAGSRIVKQDTGAPTETRSH